MAIDRKGIKTVSYPVPAGNYLGQTGYKPDGLPHICFPCLFQKVRVSHSENGYTGLEHVHGLGLSWPFSETLIDEHGEIPCFHNLSGEGIKLLSVWQNPVQKEI